MIVAKNNNFFLIIFFNISVTLCALSWMRARRSVGTVVLAGGHVTPLTSILTSVDGAACSYRLIESKIAYIHTIMFVCDSRADPSPRDLQT